VAVILKTLLAGPAGVHQAGERVEFSPDAERALVDGGFAIYDKPPARGESAVPPPRETAALPPVKRRKG
jgi:hypothetical protein